MNAKDFPKILSRKIVPGYLLIFSVALSFSATGFAREVAVRKIEKKPPAIEEQIEKAGKLPAENATQPDSTAGGKKVEDRSWIKRLFTGNASAPGEQAEKVAPLATSPAERKLPAEFSVTPEETQLPAETAAGAEQAKNTGSENSPVAAQAKSKEQTEEERAQPKEIEHYLRQKAFLEELSTEAETFRAKRGQIQDQKQKEAEIQEFRKSRLKKINAFLAEFPPSVSLRQEPAASSGNQAGGQSPL